MSAPQQPSGERPSDRPSDQFAADVALATAYGTLNTMIGRLQAMQRDLLAIRIEAALDTTGGDSVLEATTTMAQELRVSDHTMTRWMNEAWHLTKTIPVVHEAARDGQILPAHVAVICRALDPIPTGGTEAEQHANDEVRRDLAAQLVEIAKVTTPGTLRRRSRRLIDRALAEPLQQRHDTANAERAVWLNPADDGMCEITARVPAAFGVAIMDRLTQGARAKPIDDPRTFDQWRADALCSLLLAGDVPNSTDACHGIRPVITITIAATELLREGSGAVTPADVDGRVLVDTATVRRLTAEAPTWERLFVHPATGVPLAVDSYSPSAAQRRLLRLRDQTCVWPGCDTSAHRSDIDHTVDHQFGGETRLDNLAHLCRHHHVTKHATRWRMEQPEYGTVRFTSPSGKIIIREPEPVAGYGPQATESLVRRSLWATTPPPSGSPPEPALPF